MTFNTLNDALDFAKGAVERQKAGRGVHTTGSYSLGQIIEHLARSIEIGLGRVEAPPAPWLVRFLSRLMKKRFLKNGMKPGFKLPKATQDLFWPTSEVDLVLALDHYEAAVSELMSTEKPVAHPYFGDMSLQEHVALHCRHAELHFGFVMMEEI